MIGLEQTRELAQRLQTLKEVLHIDDKRKEVAEREQASQAPDFWNDAKEAEAYLKKTSSLKAWVSAWDAAAEAAGDVFFQIVAQTHCLGFLDGLSLAQLIQPDTKGAGVVVQADDRRRIAAADGVAPMGQPCFLRHILGGDGCQHR